RDRRKTRSLFRRRHERGLDLQPRWFDVVFCWSRSSGFYFCALPKLPIEYPVTSLDTPATSRSLQICTDPAFADRPERFEIDSAGQLIMSPPPGFDHRQRARAIANLLDQLHAGELATVGQPLLTRYGPVRIADVVLLTIVQKRWLIANPTSPLPTAPPVCVE